MIDYLVVSGTKEGRVIEYVDHLHEHFETPVTMRNGHYLPPEAPGYSGTMKADRPFLPASGSVTAMKRCPALSLPIVLETRSKK